MKVLRTIHTVYAVIIFALLFFLLFPLLLVPIIFPNHFRLIGVINRWWARSLFFLTAIPYKVEYRFRLDKTRQYIFCPNHFSYVDIPAMGLNHHNTIFVGKSDMEKIPFFGFMYRRLHITVNRKSLKSRFNTLKASLRALDEGKSLVIFPEGGIVTHRDPVMSRFKYGAFRAAIEKQIPIVPVTIAYNWIILPADEFVVRRHLLKVIFHEPVSPEGLTMNDVDMLRKKVYDIITVELQKHIALESVHDGLGSNANYEAHNIGGAKDMHQNMIL